MSKVITGHEAEMAVRIAEENHAMTRGEYCSEVGRLVGLVNDRIEQLPSGCVGNIFEAPSTWETRLKWLLSEINDHPVAGVIAKHLRTYNSSVAPATADEQGACWLAYHKAAATPEQKSEVDSIFGQIFGEAPAWVEGVDYARPIRKA